MTVKEILVEWLKQHGYDGLCNDYCGCHVDDLIPCMAESIQNCVGGYKRTCQQCAQEQEGPKCEWRDDREPDDFCIFEEKPREK